ncbi:MAG TPA: hypothetical protein PKV73_09830 [Agriterribacter sp.]|nr:hypothetical protein [Agriterribacter sp.]
MISIKKIIIIALSFLSCCSSPKSNHYFDLPVLKKIAQLTSILPPPPVISFTPVYVVGTDDSISESGIVKLQNVYNASYKNEYSAFYDFLFDALNQKIKIDTKSPKTYLYYSQTFLIDPNITRLYKEKGIKGLMDKYCLNRKGIYTLNRGALTLNEINSISYYFFLNQYIRADDDYEATINFKKITSIIS